MKKGDDILFLSITEIQFLRTSSLCLEHAIVEEIDRHFLVTFIEKEVYDDFKCSHQNTVLMK